MEKIVLTQEEIECIEKQLDGRISFDHATDREKEVVMGVIDKARDLMDELNAYDELGDDLIKWFYEKYKAQEGGN